MPLIIQIALGAAALAAGVFGLLIGSARGSAMRFAKAIGEDVQAKHNEYLAKLEKSRTALAARIQQFDGRRRSVIDKTLSRLFEFLARLEQTGRILALERLEEIRISPSEVREVVAQYVELGGTLRGAFQALGAGAGAGALATGLVTSCATASAGAAISGLAGAA